MSLSAERRAELRAVIWRAGQAPALTSEQAAERFARFNAALDELCAGSPETPTAGGATRKALPSEIRAARQKVEDLCAPGLTTLLDVALDEYVSAVLSRARAVPREEPTRPETSEAAVLDWLTARKNVAVNEGDFAFAVSLRDVERRLAILLHDPRKEAFYDPSRSSPLPASPPPETP